MTEVATASSNLPELAPTPASQTITADDIELRSVYIAEALSKAVSNDIVKKGAIYVAAGAEDPDAETLWEPSTKPKPGVLFYVLGWYKNKSMEVDGSFERWDIDDPTAPILASVNYNFNLAMPEVDPDMPFRMRWSRSRSGAARKVITVLARGASKAQAHKYAFRVTTELKETKGYKYFVPVVRPVDADPQYDADVQALYEMVGPTIAPVQGSRGETPSI